MKNQKEKKKEVNIVLWVFVAFVGVIGFMIATGNMGGAKKATQNYVDVHRKVVD
jgi:hypothetical protein